MKTGLFQCGDVGLVVLYEIGNGVVKEVEVVRVACGVGCGIEDDSSGKVASPGTVILEDRKDFGLE